MSRSISIMPNVLRRTMGITTILFPIVLLLFNDEELISISYFYHHPPPLGDVFVGFLCAIGFCLFAYRGDHPLENAGGWVASGAALGVALFPPSKIDNTGAPQQGLQDAEVCRCEEIRAGAAFFFEQEWDVKLHVISTFLFFVILLGFIIRFASVSMREGDRYRSVYIGLGALMLLGLAIALFGFFGGTSGRGLPTVFIGEALAVIFFGVAWLFKGASIETDYAKPCNHTGATPGNSSDSSTNDP